MLTQTQKIVAHDALRSLDERRAQIEDDISTLQEELAQIKSQQADLLSQLSPVWMAPPEVLSYIFQLVHEEEAAEAIDSIGFYEPQLKGCTFRITISHVCQHFRNVALRTAALWTVIHVTDLTFSRLDCMNAFLERSGTSPLTIILDCSYWTPSPSRSEVAEVMTLVQANMSRLKRFTAIFKLRKLLEIAAGYFDRPAPQMVTLELAANDFSYRSATTSPIRSFTFSENQMNSLTKLRLRYTPVSWSQFNIKNLIEFELVEYSHELKLGWRDFSTVLKNSSLRKLHIEDVWLTHLTEESSVQELCTLSSLEELRLSYMRLDDCLAVLSGLRAPNLKTLILWDLGLSDDYSVLLNRMIKPSILFPNLTLLQIKLLPVVDDAVVVGLRNAYPRLRSWHVDRPCAGGGSNSIDLRATAEEDNVCAVVTLG